MSWGNVEIVRAAFEAWYPNDSEEFAVSLDPEFEYHVTYGLDEGVYRGWKATVAAFDHWQDVFSDYHWQATDFIDGGDDHVIVPFAEHGLGGGSGAKAGQRPAFLCTMRDRRILRLTEYKTVAEAREAAGPGDNVELVREAIGALNDRDQDRYLALCAADWELASVVSALEGNLVGEEGVRRFFAMLEETTSRFRIEVDELRDIGDGRVLALGRAVAVSRTEELPVDTAIANVYEVAEGKLRRVTAYRDRDEAREALKGYYTF